MEYSISNLQFLYHLCIAADDESKCVKLMYVRIAVYE